MKQPIYGITAASGHLGRLSAQELLLRGVPASDVVAVVRSRSKAADEHQKTEQTLREADVPFTLLRNGWYSENYTDQLGHYLENGEIVGAAGQGRVSPASREDYAAAAIAALVSDEGGNRTYELGSPAFDLAELAQTITEVTGSTVTYRDLSVDDYANELRQGGHDEATAGFVAGLDASIAGGDLETSSQDLQALLGRPVTLLSEVVAAARHRVGERQVGEERPTATPHPADAGRTRKELLERLRRSFFEREDGH